MLLLSQVVKLQLVDLVYTSSGAQDGSALTGGKNITITSTGDDSGVKFTVKGTDINGNDLTEIITGAKAGETVRLQNYFQKL